MRFVDTNILLYSVSTHPAESGRAAVAGELLDGKDLALSVQILQEFYVQATRSSRTDALPHEDAVAFIEKWMRFPVQEMTVELLQEALAVKERWRISYWDAAVVAAAKIIGCTELLSEDLNDGQDYGGVRVINPFQNI